MRTLRGLGSAGPDADITIDAAKYAVQGQWLATNYQVDGRSPIVITARGQIDLWPEQGGAYLASPSGYRTFGGAGAAFAGKKAAVKGGGGLLLGKIGEDGDVFTIGERFEGIPPQSGKLFLHINPSPYSPQSSGSYEIQATSKRD